MSEYTIHAERMLCPMPVIALQDRISTAQPGDRITILCTDPGSLHDIPAWCRIHGHRIHAVEENEALIYITVDVCAPAEVG